MKDSASLNEFLEVICQQIRWKKTHKIISEEIRNHVIDQKNAFVKDGLDEELALEKAIKEMGDPISIGSDLDRSHRPKMEWNILILAGLMIVLGFGIRYIASFETDTPFSLARSLMATLIGMACMLGGYFIDFTLIGRYPKSIFMGLTILAILTIPLSPVIMGKHLYVQFVLLAFPTVMAGIIYNMRSKGYLGIIISGAFFTIPVLVGLRIPSISVVALISLCFLVLITMAVIKGWFNVNKLYGILLIYIPTFSVVILGLIRMISYGYYRKERFLSIVNPSKDSLGAGYVSARMREMLAGARLVGRGSLGANPYMIPEINTDYIITYLIHRLGWISLIVVIGLIITFIIYAFRLSYKQKSILGKLVSMAVLLTFIMEVIFYTITNLGLPIMGSLTLPFISYSGMSTIVNMALIGIMLSVFKSGDMVKDRLISQGHS